MFIGHYALAFAAKKAAPRANLGLLLLATSWIDMVWPVMLLLGWERVRIAPGATAYTPLVFESYPWTHSLALTVLWGLLVGGAALVWTRDRRTALAAGLLVVSHWVLDWISHAPDLPLWPGSSRFGLGLWNSVAATVAVESALFVGGLALFLGATRARGPMGHVALWSLVGTFAFMYAGNSLGLAVPPSERVLALSALIGWLPPVWGLWIEATRRLR
ncbi:MAG: hypothetical protein U0P81_05140 [Holophagaceae bacterium]